MLKQQTTYCERTAAEAKLFAVFFVYSITFYVLSRKFYQRMQTRYQIVKPKTRIFIFFPDFLIRFLW